MPSIESSDAHNNWVKDGSASTAPVTSSTPELTESTPQAETSSQTTEEPVVETPAAETQATVEEFIEAQLNGQPYKLPKGVQLPWKRGGQTGYAPVEDVLKAEMQERDYRIKTAETAQMRRQLEAERARMAAREQWLKEEEERIRATFQDPAALQRRHEHMERLKSDPDYRRWVEEAQRARELEAENTTYRQADEAAAIQSAAEQFRDELHRVVAEKYPGVDPVAVQQRAAQALVSGQADLSEATIHWAAQMEAETQKKYVQPIQSQIEQLRAELAEAKKAAAEAARVAAHNSNTSHALKRGLTVTTAPTGGAAPGQPGKQPPKPYTSEQAEERKREWIRKG